MNVAALDALSDAAARETLVSCSGATAWVAAMLAARPWRTPERLLDEGERAWATLTRTQIAEAIAHHPRLGESRAAAALGERASRWSGEEQLGARVATDDTRAALARRNAEYERRFGHTFILCASGVSAQGMLAALESRLRNDPASELAITAGELWKITRLRLERLIAGA